MSTAVADLIAKRFIARRDVKAIQVSDNMWTPHTDTGKHDGQRLPWTRADLMAHLEGTQTFGHYLLDTDSTCKVFAFDIDLEKKGELPVAGENPEDPFAALEPCDDLREAWRNRAHPGRPYMKLQFKELSQKLLRGVYEELGVPCAVAYSGGKGVHVYAFTGKIPAAEAREGAMIVLDSVPGVEVNRGRNFFKHKEYPNLSIEVFPKQDSLDGKDLGNLMRLPLGRNKKSTDPTFFIDMTSAMAQMVPLDPEFALTTTNPWEKA